MLLYKREYFISDELTLTNSESFLIMKIKFLLISKDIMQQLKYEFVSINHRHIYRN